MIPCAARWSTRRCATSGSGWDEPFDTGGWGAGRLGARGVAVKIFVALTELLLGERGELVFIGVRVIFCGDTEKLLFRAAAVILREMHNNVERTLLIMW